MLRPRRFRKVLTGRSARAKRIEQDQINLLQKPFSPLALAARVRDLLDRR